MTSEPHESHEDEVHEVTRVYGRCRFCGFASSWTPDQEEAHFDPCEACGEPRGIGAFEGIDAEDQAGFAAARGEVQNAILRRIAYGIERLVSLAKEATEDVA